MLYNILKPIKLIHSRKIKDLFKKTALTAHERLGLPRGQLVELVAPIVDQLGDAHPELRQQQQAVVDAVFAEERRMWAQRDEGRRRLKNMLGQLPKGTEKFPGF